jgi:hypothetical protein
VNRRIPDAHIGPIRSSDLSSSTLWTVFNLHKFGFDLESSSVTMAALSKNLQLMLSTLSN